MHISQIDEIVCLALDKRHEKWSRLHQQFKQLNREMQIYLCGNGHIFDKNYYCYIDNLNRCAISNAAQCHKNIIATAKQKNTQCLLMLEDDAILTNDFEERLSEINYDQFDILWLGSFTPFIKQVEETVKTEVRHVDKTIGGLHGILIKQCMFDIFSHFTTDKAIDTQLGSIALRTSRMFYLAPSIVIMDTGYSYANSSTNNVNDNSGLSLMYKIALQRGRISLD